ncbi:MAG: hypothetical protein KIT41_14325, partial [Pyrinomonadaceae bacterium]|nr:hypothetical protein [Pyrinomonadaceae bacterium]
ESESLPDKRGHVLAEYVIPKETHVPKSIAVKTGAWYELPQGWTLRQVSVELYGTDWSDDPGFWERAASAHPEIFDRVREIVEVAAEAAEETREAISEAAKIGGGVVLVGGILWFMLGMRRS